MLSGSSPTANFFTNSPRNASAFSPGHRRRPHRHRRLEAAGRRYRLIPLGTVAPASRSEASCAYCACQGICTLTSAFPTNRERYVDLPSFSFAGFKMGNPSAAAFEESVGVRSVQVPAEARLAPRAASDVGLPTLGASRRRSRPGKSPGSALLET